MTNSPNNPQNPKASPLFRIVEAQDAADLDSIANDNLIDWVTVPGFLRRIGNNKPWGIANVTRFGKMANQSLDAFGAIYQTAYDPQLGQLRVFPAALLTKVYNDLSPSLGWPKMESAAPASAESSEKVRAELELKLAMVAQLRMLSETAQDGDVRQSAKVLLVATEVECQALETQVARAKS